MGILITTSRRTNQRTRRLAKELSWVIPFSVKINRGRMSLDDLKEFMFKEGFSRLIIITSKRGNPFKLLFLTPYHNMFEYNLQLYIEGVKLQLDAQLEKTIFSELEIEYVNGDIEIYNKLSSFIGKHLYDPSRDKGGTGKLVIDKTNSLTILKFTDLRGSVVYPVLKVYRKSI